MQDDWNADVLIPWLVDPANICTLLTLPPDVAADCRAEALTVATGAWVGYPKKPVLSDLEFMMLMEELPMCMEIELDALGMDILAD